MAVGFGVFFGDAQVEGPWLQYQALGGDDDFFNGIIQTGIQNPGGVDGQIAAQMNIVGIGTQVLTVKGLNQNMALGNLGEDTLVG